MDNTDKSDRVKRVGGKIAHHMAQITDVVTDKTGTLTRNEMVFKKGVIRGTVYGNKGATADMFNDEDLQVSLPRAV